tara:strand:+ start:197 stop:517 length:321 start_codon:yes stop_codon:yes gene_type:complete
MKEKESVENLISEATSNVQEDRAATKVLLMNLMKYMQSSDDRHREVGIVAAKYLETLQRSNEQLVKIASLVHKKTSLHTDSSISDKEKDEIFEMINSSMGGESDDS